MNTAAVEAPEIVVDVAPFDLGDRSARRAALCLHGLTGTPYEVRSLGEALAAAGVRAVGPVLPGHDESPAALAALRHTDWLESVREKLRRLRAEHERVVVVGLSLGGLLALALGSEEPVDALAVVGTPLRFRRVVRWGVPVLKYVFPFVKKGQGSDIRDPAARRRHPSFPVMPLRSVHELMPLQRRVEAGLASIRAPILVAHGRLDTTANPVDARTIYERVASPQRRLLILEDSGHVVPVDLGASRLAEAVVELLQFVG